MAIAQAQLTNAKVHLFYDEAYTDTAVSPGSDPDAEASELVQSIESFSHDITTFVGTDAEWVTAAQNADVIAIPNIDAPFVLSAAAAFALKQFVDGGGTLIVLGGVTGEHNTNLVNSLFAQSFVHESFKFESSTKTGDTSGTNYAGAPGALGDGNGNDHTSGWDSGSLPGYVESLYENTSGDSTVAAFQYGKGQIVWLGWNWNNALPSLGAQDNGWLNVLNRSISLAEGPSGNVVNGTKKDDKVGFDLVGKKFDSTDRDDIVDLKKGDDKANGGEGHDTILGGKGDDKLSGEGDPDTLSGGEGKDQLKGGSGGDYFLFDVKLKGANADKIQDFDEVNDKILLDASHYAGLTAGVMTAQQFEDHVTYTEKGVLKYDGTVFAKVGRDYDIDQTDFLVVG